MEQLAGVIGTLIIFGLIISLHEFGHYMVAKMSGMAVQEYSLGFGPALWSRELRGTLYALRIIPLGGYVRIAGMEVGDEDHPNGYDKKPWGAKFLTIVAGAAMNFVLAFIVLIVLGMAVGYPIPHGPALVGGVQPNSPAAKAGLEPGDRFLTINGTNVADTEQAFSLIHNNSKASAIAFTIEHQGTRRTLTIPTTELQTAELDNHLRFHLSTYQGIGVAITTPLQKIGAWESVKQGVLNVYDKTVMVLASLISLFAGSVPVSGMAGPPRIINMSYDVSRHAINSAEGMAQFLMLIAFLSINIGFVNLLPIPALDGGHLLVLCIEGIRRKPFDRQKEAMVHMIGMLVLLGLILLISLNDVWQMMHPK